MTCINTFDINALEPMLRAIAIRLFFLDLGLGILIIPLCAMRYSCGVDSLFSEGCGGKPFCWVGLANRLFIPLIILGLAVFAYALYLIIFVPW